MEPKRGYHLGQLWADHATDITKKVTNSTDVTLDDIRRAAAAAANKPTAQLPDSVFLRVLGTSEANLAPPQTGSLAQRATEEWERCICENKAFAILKRKPESRQSSKKMEAKCLLQ
jgi:hypothetical protein